MVELWLNLDWRSSPRLRWRLPASTRHLPNTIREFPSLSLHPFVSFLFSGYYAFHAKTGQEITQILNNCASLQNNPGSKNSLSPSIFILSLIQPQCSRISLRLEWITLLSNVLIIRDQSIKIVETRGHAYMITLYSMENYSERRIRTNGIDFK